MKKTNCCHSKQLLEIGSEYLCSNSACTNYLNQCKPVVNRKAWRHVAALTLFGFYFLFSVDDFSMNNKRREVVMRNESLIVPIPLNEDNLEKELLSREVICPKEVMAQIKLESGNLNSSLLKKTNNMLGMRFPYGRETKAIGIYLVAKDTIVYGNSQELKKYRSLNQYAVFNSWQDAVEDYKLWQVANFRLAEKYLNFLGNVYATDTAYVDKIKRVAAKGN